MAETSVPKTQVSVPQPGGNRLKFLIGGGLLLAVVAFLIFNTLTSQQEFYVTVNELQQRGAELHGRNIRVLGVVLGDTIQYDGHTLSFEIAHIPDSTAQIQDDGGLAEVLHRAATDPAIARIRVVLVDQPKPDLLQNEAQAIVTGTLGEDGVFHANELLLKCPTRYQQQVPQSQ
jgi:cytochrome c-type biogenesis protein CcmE